MMSHKNKIGLPLTFAAIAIALQSALCLAIYQSTDVSRQLGVTPTHETDDTLASQQAQALVQQMTQDEKLNLVYGYFGNDYKNWANNKTTLRHPESIVQSAGFVAGVPRLGIPALYETDAGIGVASQPGPTPRLATALPSGLAIAATWDKELAFQGGKMIGLEAKAFGFNVMLAGAANLIREPLNGRNFEYASEDPLLTGIMVGEQIRGIQSNQVISTLKHFALNVQETKRNSLDARIDETAFRESDLLAFHIALTTGNPGAVMCAYNKVNGFYACENEFLLNKILKQEWGFKGFVMSDWGAAHSTIPAAVNGLDQESAGEAFDLTPYFGLDLKEAVNQGWVPSKRLDDMAQRVVFAMARHGLLNTNLVKPTINEAENEAISAKAARQSMVLLKNEQSILPLASGAKNIILIGGHADKGVLSGGGSSKVYPRGGLAVNGLTPADWPGPVIYFPSSPLKALQQRQPNTHFTYISADQVDAQQAKLAAADSIIVFATQWIGEDNDARSYNLPDNQDDLIAKSCKINPRCVVVLETGGAIAMPWLNQTQAVLAAWYPGTRGGEAIADILLGRENPSGRLPISFPVALEQTPRAAILGGDTPENQTPVITYTEGASVGYKWFDKNSLSPQFPFGFGLSYTQFSYANARVITKDRQPQLSVEVTNIGSREGNDVVQVYAGNGSTPAKGTRRLAGWEKVHLQAGQSATLNIPIDERVLQSVNLQKQHWVQPKGELSLYWGRNFADALAKQPLNVKRQ